MTAVVWAVLAVPAVPVLGWLLREAFAELSLTVEARRYRHPLTDAERAAYGLPPAPPAISAPPEMSEEARSAGARGDGPGVNR